VRSRRASEETGEAEAPIAGAARAQPALRVAEIFGAFPGARNVSTQKLFAKNLVCAA
jgi:hypothetical protein